MARPILTDELWEEIRPLLPQVPPRRPDAPCRPRLCDRACLTGILFLLRTGMAWADLPAELGCGSGMSCWRRLRDWTQAGVWPKVHQVLLRHLNATGKIDGSRAVIDSASVRAVFDVCILPG
jgi:transposase